MIFRFPVDVSFRRLPSGALEADVLLMPRWWCRAWLGPRQSVWRSTGGRIWVAWSARDDVALMIPGPGALARWLEFEWRRQRYGLAVGGAA